MDGVTDIVRSELYFLVTKFLEDGPCKKAVTALKAELLEHKIIPCRYDWTGNEQEQTYEDFAKKFSHIGSRHLLDMCLRLGPLLEKEVAPGIPGIKSLLGAGRHSMLRTPKDTYRRYLNLSCFIARQHSASIYSPISCHHHNIVQVLYGRETSGPCSRRHAISTRLYSRTHLLNRTLGHLSAVYCLLYDRTGKFVVTGADDLLIKVWSAVDGRLLSTFRGASAEITDIAINLENTLLAAGSLDKIIRVWCLQSSFPVAVLSGHTGAITAVNFCPVPINDVFYLVSTSSDGSVAFWSYTVEQDEPATFQSKPLQYNEKMRPGQAQMLCARFSNGGMFLATGSADHYVRVYCMDGEQPHRIMEMEKHTDRVDSIQWANRSLQFISGSKDGTAVIWRFKAQNWVTKHLIMSTSLLGQKSSTEDNKVKLKVTMVSWSADDSYVITAVTDNTLKVWSPTTGKLLSVLNSHKDEVYVLESHPLDSRVLLSAGHDGILYLWDLLNGEILVMFHNHIEGQGSCAIFDAKWSPDGTMIAAADSHGHLLMFGIAAYNNKMKELPKELFFHTDYRPLVRDAQNNVLDEQTQVPPHLMPPPFLVDIDGNPYPPELQRLVPGREHCPSDQLIPNIIYNAGGQQEVIQSVGENNHNIIEFFEELVQRSLGSRNHHRDGVEERHSTQPRLRWMTRRGNVEGVRQSSGNWQRDGMDWKQGVLISPLSQGMLSVLKKKIGNIASLELEEYRRESIRSPEIVPEVSEVQSCKKPRRRHLHSYRTRSAREQVQEQNDAEELESSSSHADSSDSSAHSEDMDTLSSSSEMSTEYSDWVADHGVNLEPPQRNRRKSKRKTPPSAPKAIIKKPPQIHNNNNNNNNNNNSSIMNNSSSSSSSSVNININTTSNHFNHNVPQEIPELYRPSEWLSEVIPKKFPYYPQMGDEVMFFTQGYEQYLRAVCEKKVYEVAKSQFRPWGRLALNEPELVKVIGIKYELRPPRLCCLRLAVMKENGRLTGDRFTIKYHDIPDVIDFFVLKQTYDIAMQRKWKIGDRFRSMIDDGWWWGTIESRRPHSNSAFLCHRIKWDNGECEAMSPWDMEPVDMSREPEHGGSVPVLPEEIAAILYHPRGDEWPGGDREFACHRILSGLEEIMGLSVAEPFIAPVDINIYPSYAYIVEFPIDLSTIKARFENRFYRRVTAAQFDIRYLATNAEKFNEPHSSIVKQARIVTDLCLRICKDQTLVDVTVAYRQLLDSYQSSNSENEQSGPSTSDRQRAAASRSLRAMIRANNEQPDWKRDCRQLLEVLYNCQDSAPFRNPVDRLEHPDYHKVIDSPMDLCTIREELYAGNYATPLEFCKDIRTIFSNSRSYNTNKRSKIYVMTVRLSAMAEEHMKKIIQNWKSVCRRQNRKTNGIRTRRRRRVNYADQGANSSDDDVERLYGARGTRTRNRVVYTEDKASSSDELPERSTRTGNSKQQSGNSNSAASSSSSSSSSTNSNPLIDQACSSRTGSYSLRQKIIQKAPCDSESEGTASQSSSFKSKVSQKDEKNGLYDEEKNEAATSSSSSSSEVPPVQWTMNGHIRVLRPVRRPETEVTNENTVSSVSKVNNSDGGSGSSSGTSSSSNSSNSEDSDSSQDDESDEDYNINSVNNNKKQSKKRMKSTSDTDYSQCSQPSNSLSVAAVQRTSRPKRVIKRRRYADESASDSSYNENEKRTVRPRRTIKKCQYRESIESSDHSVENIEPKISISSRGRIRKITARARAFLRD
ncbi:hypothetical protein O3M35_000212 [Rhynocoris fuscipes]|uniref:Bromo domain-containing protein n=1 Tax=Rhynocoris fuscipes TaxID=488301 RepID=A0AAW1DLU0_9HEMI